ncbi:MAG: ATP-dependent DNA ligase [Candidatus Micrarchaeota archaeon]|nr:ATP-dependent DNA ligase [Candidatus Micrarchaeota archaeon]
MRFSEVAEYFSKVEETASRLSMSGIIAELFSKCCKGEARPLIYIIEGNVAPSHEGLDVGIGERFAIRAIASTAGYPEKKVESDCKKSGDLGTTAENLLLKKAQLSLGSSPNELLKVHAAFLKIAKLSGQGSQESKIRLLSELLNGATPLEAKYLVRFCLGKLRLGVGDPSIIDALSMLKKGGKEDKAMLERAFNLCSDLGEVAEVYLSGSDLSRFSAQPGKPIRPALAERLANADEIIEKLGKCAVEAKYDGLRMQVHLKDGEVEIYSRKLEKMTHMFPEIVEAAAFLPAKSAVFEGEALAYNAREKKYYSFQQTIQRKRKYGVEEMAKDFPLRLFAFDIMYLDGKDLTLTPYLERRKTLEKLVKGNKAIVPSDLIYTDSPKKLNEYFERATNEGLEGIIAKDLEQPYVAGARKFAWIKLKKSYGEMADTLDVVVVGYYLGKGAREEFKFGGLLAAVQNEETGELETVAKIGSGFTEGEMGSLEEMLAKIRTKEKPKGVNSKLVPDFWVTPQHVITVAADEITLSPMHTCGMMGETGYALRFPRMVSMREDKGVDREGRMRGRRSQTRAQILIVSQAIGSNGIQTADKKIPGF